MNNEQRIMTFWSANAEPSLFVLCRVARRLGEANDQFFIILYSLFIILSEFHLYAALSRNNGT